MQNITARPLITDLLTVDNVTSILAELSRCACTITFRKSGRLDFGWMDCWTVVNFYIVHIQGRIQDLVKGAPKFFWLIFANSAQQSRANKVSPYWLGSRASLRALEALGFFITKYAFSPFWGTFSYYF